VTLPEVVTGELAGKFGEISLFDHHADFELGSASNSSSTSPWAIVCEPVTQPSHVDSPPCKRFTCGPRNVSRAHMNAPTTHRAGKEPVPECDSDSDTAPGHASDSNPLFGFYSDSAYEFDFGSDPEELESEDNSTERCVQEKSSPSLQKMLTSCELTTGSLSRPPARNRDNEATSRSADLGRNRTRAELPANPNRTRATAGGPSQGGNSTAAAGGDREIASHRDPGGGGSDDGSSNHGANRRVSGGGNRGGRRYVNSHASRASQGGFDAR
jgi:hypothetical protein